MKISSIPTEKVINSRRSGVGLMVHTDQNIERSKN
jgi:hypothetical protein